MTRVDQLGALVVVDGQSSARQVLASSPTSVALIDRGGLRAVVFHCPCGCGDVLSINTDARTPPAWRAIPEARGLTLMPSVWRTSGCASHFVVWRSRVFWCSFDADGTDDWPADMNRELRDEWRRIRQARRFRGER